MTDATPEQLDELKQELRNRWGSICPGNRVWLDDEDCDALVEVIVPWVVGKLRAPKPADSQLVEVLMRELGVQEMVMADPQTLKRLQAERILRALAPHLSPSPSDAERDRMRQALILARRTLAVQPHPVTRDAVEDKQHALTIIDNALTSGAHREAGE